MKLQAQKGTKDILPVEISTWQMMESAALKVFGLAGFKEIRTPIFEATELFSRGVGDSTDIVNKEMYTFEKNGRSLTLRPENTAGVVRAYIENGFSRMVAPVKLWYKGPMFRYERPQAGRQRQFHQVGIEIFGSCEPAADAQCINMAVKYLNELGLNDLTVELNSLGCTKCRNDYKTSLREAIKPDLHLFCSDCKIRYDKNPLRILDCKVDSCINALKTTNTQEIINKDFICDECKEHFSSLKKYLDVLKIKYILNNQLVRGLDYYNRTVFEIKSYSLGAQNAVCGGGRYDGLVEMLGGEPTGAVGWAMGMERLSSLIIPASDVKPLEIFIVSDNVIEAMKLAEKLNSQGISADFEYGQKKFKRQIEKASKIANFAILLGEDELKENYLTLKNLETGIQQRISIDELYKIFDHKKS